MKKIISLIVALMMLVSAFAMAEGVEVSIGNVVLKDDTGYTIDFSGIELKFAAAQNYSSAGVSIAAAANGEDVVRAVLSMDEAGVYLSADGISDVYSLSLDTIMEMLDLYAGEINIEEDANQMTDMLMDAGMKLMGILQESLTEVGTQVVDGIEHQAYELNITPEQFMEIYAIYDDFLALYPQILAGTGYDSLVDMFTDAGIEGSMDGIVLYSEESMMIDLYSYANGEAVANVFLSIENSYYEDMGLDGLDIYVALYDPAIEDINAGEIGYAIATVYTDPESGEFVMFDFSVGADEEGIYGALNLGSGDYKYLILGTLDQVTEFGVFWGKDENGFNVAVELSSEDVGFEAEYVMPDDGKGKLDIVVNDGYSEISASADITVSETDGAWLPEIGETVDIMTMDENQMNKLTMEGMGIAGKLLSACSAASEDFANLMASMM